MNCLECAIINSHQPCEACTCPKHGVLLEPKPDPANKGRTKIWVCPICSKDKH